MRIVILHVGKAKQDHPHSAHTKGTVVYRTVLLYVGATRAGVSRRQQTTLIVGMINYFVLFRVLDEKKDAKKDPYH